MGHVPLQELKGNIRVFCRVRPVSAAEQASSDHDSTMAVEFPESGELLSAGITLQVKRMTATRDASHARICA